MKLLKRWSIGLSLILSPFLLLGLFYWAMNRNDAEGWFRTVIADPIPSSVSNLTYGGFWGMESVRCFRFDISKEDADALISKHRLVLRYYDPDEKTRRLKVLEYIFSGYGKLEIEPFLEFIIYESTDDTSGISRTILIHPERTRIYYFYAG